MKPRKSSFFRICALTLCLVTFTTCTGCQKSPESSIVVNKDLDKLIGEASTPDTNKVNIEDIIKEEYDSYVTTLKDESLGVTVNVNAKVDIPQTDHLSIFRVEQQKFTQEQVDQIRAALLGDTELYDGAALEQYTKARIEAEIAYFQLRMSETKDNASLNKYYQDEIDKLQQKYDDAPAEIRISDYPFDGKLHTVPEKYNEDPENLFWSWLNTLEENGDFLYGATDKAGGCYVTFYVQNSYDKSNKIVFRKNPYGYEHFSGVMVGCGSLIAEKTNNSDLPDNFLNYSDYFIPDDTPLVSVPGETVELSQEDAIEVADAFIKKVGLDAYAYFEGGLFSEIIRYEYESDPMDKLTYRTYYVLEYRRKIDGVFLTGGSKTDMGDPEKGNYTKKSWPSECIQFRINDSGIVGFDYNAPLNIVETVVEDSALRSFENARSTFEKMMIVINASVSMTKVFDINRVRLSYTRISEADSFDTGLIVPVWDFIGECGIASDGMIIYGDRSGSFLTVNAIDGSIIDPELGY